MLNRKRFNFRKIVTIKNACILATIVCVVIVSTTIIGGHVLKKKVASSTIVFKNNDNNVLDENILMSETIENIQAQNESLEDKEENNSESNNKLENNPNSNVIVSEERAEEIKKLDDGIVTINLLGELMMGGTVTKNLNYSYANGIKGVYATTRLADFTYCNFPTNITNLEKIENSKSKYLVTSNITSALNALGIDAVSIASDHIIDFPSDILGNTISILEKNDIFVAGREDMPVYFEKGDKKIAIVSTNTVIIGTAKNYTNNDISIYSKENLKKNIEEAKENADIVIADIHWGRDHTYGVTNQMREYAKVAIDSRRRYGNRLTCVGSVSYC